MNEIYYQIKLFFAFLIIFSFISWINFDLMKKNQFSGTDFNGINNNFEIIAGNKDEKNIGNIYLPYRDSIPDNCIGENKKSISCLKTLKSLPEGGFYNGLPYKPAKNIETNEEKIRSISNKNCLDILETGGNIGNGVYKINPYGTGEFDIYCDMITDGGGWTFTTILADSDTKNLFDTGNGEKINNIETNIYSKGRISDLRTINEDKDIMIVCKSNKSEGLKYEDATIIYDFPKTDISNLTKDKKVQGNKRLYNGDYINIKYKNNYWQLNKDWGDSSYKNSHYFMDIDGKYIISFYDGNSFFSRGISPTQETYFNTPAFFEPRGRRVMFDQDNYCMTAIR